MVGSGCDESDMSQVLTYQFSLCYSQLKRNKTIIDR
jgi:hypothetical protein